MSPEQKKRAAENMRRYRAEKKETVFTPPQLTVEQRRRQAEAQSRYRERQKERGVARVTTDKERENQRVYVAKRRAEAKATGEILPSDSWWKDNPEKHRERGQRWREANPERSAELTRQDQAKRRSTPWGKINNNMWPSLHRGVRGEHNVGAKQRDALGYTWADLRAHLEAQFTQDMNWDNWGDIWEVDHIAPLSSFHYTSLDDPLFKECWALSNLRPLCRHENASKGSKPIPA